MDGHEFGRYRLRRLIGSGGMGDVYEAVETVRDRAVALKLLPELFSGNAHAVGHTTAGLTMSGSTVGTLDYMALERLLDGVVDRRADVDDGTVTVVDIATNQVTGRPRVCASPTSVAMVPGGDRWGARVTCLDEAQLAVLGAPR